MIFPLRRRKIVETRKNKMMIDTQVNFYLYFHTQKNCQHYYFEIRVKKADTKVIGSHQMNFFMSIQIDERSICRQTVLARPIKFFSSLERAKLLAFNFLYS